MKKNLTIISLAIISIIFVGCNSNNKNKEFKEEIKYIDVNNCKNCVFAYYTDSKTYGENGDILTDYTVDYTALKDNKGNQKKNS